MTITLTIATEEADNIVFAVEAGMEKLRRKFAPERPPDACCHACGDTLLHDYVRLRQIDGNGQPIWLHIGSCLTKFASSHCDAAEARLNENGEIEI
ncbi:MAG: hypothetical protein HOC88_08990 [Rhodospirillaceae bacterium]|nr:hypothetical protein [Rhodospirillaceae bacterium]